MEEKEFLFGKLKPTTKECINIAYRALQAAYSTETDFKMTADTDEAKRVGELLTQVGKFTRT